jgi:NADH-quinone oxidoreductase subunit A
VNLENYFPILLFILVGIGVGVVPQVLGRLLAPFKPDAQKLSPYECGFEAFEDARMKFDVRYYLVAILFILFDLETAFFFPWGRSHARPGLGRLRDNDGIHHRIHCRVLVHLEERCP